MIELLNLNKCYKILPSLSKRILRRLKKPVFATKAGVYYVLRQIDRKVSEGEFITIMAPSGAGKSTLLSILGILAG